jgi:hypothetical protein
VAGVDEGAVAPTADAAQVSASKRFVGRAKPLTFFDRPRATVSGHDAGFNRMEGSSDNRRANRAAAVPYVRFCAFTEGS